MTNVVCPDCDIEYQVKSSEAEEEGIIPSFCPFCGFETTDELDFEEDDYTNARDEDDDDWDNWHPDDRF
jgi:uncharacterized Zn finger protein (UPF0148 family)